MGITPALATIVVGIVSALATVSAALPLASRRTRRAQRRSAAQIDAAEAWIYAALSVIRRHNNEIHPDGRCRLDEPRLPSYMIDAAREDEGDDHARQ